MITFTSSNIASVIGYTTTLFDDFKLLIFLLIGLPLGFWIIESILNALQERLETKRQREEAEEELEEAALRPIFKRYHAHQVEVTREGLIHED